MKLKLKDVRLSFSEIFTASDYQGDKMYKYKATFLTPQGGEVDTAIQAEIKRAVAEKIPDPKKAAAFLASCTNNSNKNAYVSGDTKSYEGYEGMMALSAKRPMEKGRPDVRNKLAQPVTQEDQQNGVPGVPYSGCYVDAIVEIWVQYGTKNDGIRCSLLGVQFRRDGDAFSGGASTSDDDFESLEAGTDADELS